MQKVFANVKVPKQLLLLLALRPAEQMHDDDDINSDAVKVCQCRSHSQ